MWDTIRKLQYRANAKVPGARAELDARLHDRVELPLSGIMGERLYLTGLSMLKDRAAQLQVMYDQLPYTRGTTEFIILDAWSSATIEGARTTVAKVKASFAKPISKDDKMVVNAVRGSNYAYSKPITRKNLRILWEKVTEGVCDNLHLDGKPYRSGMVEVGNEARTVHTPALPHQIPDLMEQWFCYRDTDQSLIGSFVAHFYFVYVHPFCDGNGRTARIVNSASLLHAGWRKIKNLPLSSAINNNLPGYYRSLEDSEEPIRDLSGKWLDISPFVSYMLDMFEQCMIDAALSKNELTQSEAKILERMNRIPGVAEITVKKAAAILGNSESAARNTLNNLVKKNYLTVEISKTPFIYVLNPHMPLVFRYDMDPHAFGYIDCKCCGSESSVIYDRLNLDINSGMARAMCIECQAYTTVFECPQCGQAYDNEDTNTKCTPKHCIHND